MWSKTKVWLVQPLEGRLDVGWKHRRHQTDWLKMTDTIVIGIVICPVAESETDDVRETVCADLLVHISMVASSQQHYSHPIVWREMKGRV